MSSVETVEFTLMQALESKNASFNSIVLPINQCKSISIQATTSSSSSLKATIEIEGSIDGDSWAPLKGTFTNLTGDITLLFSLSDLNSLGYIRASVTIDQGSSLFYIIGRTI
jgi:hypothetical protein